MKTAKKKKLGKLAMRVAIAKDVIAQIKAGSLNMRQGFFLEGAGLPTYFGGLSESAVQETLVDGRCSTCAKGALFVSYVRRFDGIDGFKVSNFRGSGWSPELEELFGGALWCRAERVFERVGNFYSGIKLPPTAKGRGLWLMRNIIKSGGRSVLPMRKAKQ